MRAYTIFFNPTDHPDKFVVREFDITIDGPVPTENCHVSEDLGSARSWALADSLEKGRAIEAQLPRSRHDEPQIVETWI